MTTRPLKYAKNASKLHRAMGDCLVSSEVFSHYRIEQEVSVRVILPTYPFGSHKFDYAIFGINVVIECHGKQHYDVQTFGQEMAQAVQGFKNQRKRDQAKKDAALTAGFVYIEVPYTALKKIDEDLIWGLYLEGQKELETYVGEEIPTDHAKQTIQEEVKRAQSERRKAYLESPGHKATLERARDYRKKRYQEQKRIKDGRS